jgi:2-C-methyl-D-erythritol 4-phosphate cytidylyltransferase/2-C-methyl-D-erythritol 2,4-cyclodiphosphate synthase
MVSERAVVIVVAGGRGVRMGGDTPKQYLPLGGQSVLWRTLMCFEMDPLIDGIVLVLHRDDMSYCQQTVIRGAGFKKIRALVPGGAQRSESVRAGLGETTAADEIVLVHDAVRPFVARELIARVIGAAVEAGAALPALPVKETVKVVEDGLVVSTPARESLWGAQTPQAFRRDVLLRAHAMKAAALATDDAMLVEALGVPVRVVAGDETNLKLTTPADLAWAKQHIEESGLSKVGLRVGQGYDVHRLVEGRKLILGGIEIPFHLGLLGHSDADVLTHAIIDALAGAIGEGDIGRLFPDDDAAYKDISSLVLLEHVRVILRERGAEIVNIDAVVMAQRPKLAPHIEAMRAALADVLKIELEAISLKATTTEQLGFVGREEGLAAQAVALVQV